MPNSPLPHAWGVTGGYRDTRRRWQTAPAATVEAVLEQLGACEGQLPPSPRHRFIRQGHRLRLSAGASLRTEDGATLENVRSLPTDLPCGYHGLTDANGAEALLIVTPHRCPLPDAKRIWGWATQLYALRSTASWGSGDLGDLADLGQWSAELGAGMVMVNPLHASLPTLPQQSSPYYPSSRRYRNPLYIKIEEVPGARGLGIELERLSAAGRALNEQPHIDRDAVYRLKMEALQRIWSMSPDCTGFDAFLSEEGEDLLAYASFCVLCEERGPDWRDWPAEVRHPAATGVIRVRERCHDRVRFHAWLQWLLDEQLANAVRALPAMQDLAVGVDPRGADAWLTQDVLAEGFTVGAPPDTFNPQGQDWGLPPFDPWKLRSADYRPFIAVIRAALRHAGALRVDHVIGLFRLFWVPHGSAPAAGTYVRYPSHDLLDLLALESSRAGAPVVGEDLGTVEAGVRARLAARNVLSYRLLWFERNRPERFPRKAMAAVTTHDLPTIAGLWTGSDLQELRDLHLHPDEEAAAEVLRRLRRWTGCSVDTPIDDLIVAVHEALATAPSLILCATLDDLLAASERPNVPGTIQQRPNWSIALPGSFEELRCSPLALRVAAALRHGTGTAQRPVMAPDQPHPQPAVDR